MAFPEVAKRMPNCALGSKKGQIVATKADFDNMPARRKNPLGKKYGDDQISEAWFQKKPVLPHHSGR